MTAPNARRSKTHEHESPFELFEVLDERYGPFTIDAAAAPKQHIPEFIRSRGGAFFVAPGTDITDLEGVYEDGLTRYWGSTDKPERIWLNCPYDQKSLSAWTDKAVREVTEGRALVVCALLPAVKSEQAWWQRNVMRSVYVDEGTCAECGPDGWKVAGCPVLRRVWYVPGRQQFSGAASATFPSVVVIWSKQPLG